MDKHHHQQVKDYFFNLLIQASIKQQPYTEIISAQAMGLAAVCEAVIDYNKIIANTAFAPIKIHQYLSDLPTAGATHFFKVLLNLNSKATQQIYLYGVNLADSEMYSKLKARQFAKLISINSQENPLVRPGFQDGDLSRIDPAQFTMLKLQANHQEIDYPVEANARVASIMLGSQAATDTTQYVKMLAHPQSPYDIVFVFGAKKPHIAHEISELVAKSLKKIIPLDEQSDKQMAPIFTRSQLVIIRGGGLTIMEQLALPCCEDKIMLIHCKNEAWGLTSGISWEDANVDLFIQKMRKIKVMVKRTSIQHFEQDLLEIKNNLFNDKRLAMFKDAELSLTTY
jgi:effector protein SdbA